MKSKHAFYFFLFSIVAFFFFQNCSEFSATSVGSSSLDSVVGDQTNLPLSEPPSAPVSTEGPIANQLPPIEMPPPNTSNAMSCQLGYDREVILEDGFAVLSWKVIGASRVSITYGVGQNLPHEGVVRIQPSSTRVYTLTARNSAGKEIKCSKEIQVEPRQRTAKAIGFYSFNIYLNSIPDSEIERLLDNRIDYVITDWKSAERLVKKGIFCYVVINALRPQNSTFYWGEDYRSIATKFKEHPYILGYMFNEPLTPYAGMTPQMVEDWTKEMKSIDTDAKVHVIFAGLAAANLVERTTVAPYMTNAALAAMPSVDGISTNPYVMENFVPNRDSLYLWQIERLEVFLHDLFQKAKQYNKEVGVMPQTHLTEGPTNTRAPNRREMCRMINTGYRIYKEHYPSRDDLIMIPYVGAWAGQYVSPANRDFLSWNLEADCEAESPVAR